jgi:hypothetical protein
MDYETTAAIFEGLEAIFRAGSRKARQSGEWSMSDTCEAMADEAAAQVRVLNARHD